MRILPFLLIATLPTAALAQAGAQQTPPVDTSASAAVAAQRSGAATPPAQSANIALPGTRSRAQPQGEGKVPDRAPIDGVLVLYGNERCPTNSDGAEIVVCERRDAQEQYRVPKELRDFVITPQNQSWAARAQGTLDAAQGVDTIGSCSAVGAGGYLGCFAQQAKAAKAERRIQNKAANPDLP